MKNEWRVISKESHPQFDRPAHVVKCGETLIALVSPRSDGHLVAAAPELKDALFALIREHSRDGLDRNEKYVPLLEDCYAALRKASGIYEE